MGLDDIDECDPLPKTKNLGSGHAQVLTGIPIKGSSGNSGCIGAVDLGDLFGDSVVSNMTPVTLSKGDSVHLGTDVQRPKPAEDFLWNSVAPLKQEGHQLHSKQSVNDQFNDPLDTFFTSTCATDMPATSRAHNQASVNDLFDLSRPAERARYSDERFLLEAFENQGKRQRPDTRDGPLLADLSKGSSNNIVKARLLKLMNYYDVLGVSRDATQEKIRQQYKRKALELHPDRVGRDQTPEEAELFKVITKAHEVLSDLGERAKYDEELQLSEGGIGNEEHWFSHLRPQ